MNKLVILTLLVLGGIAAADEVPVPAQPAPPPAATAAQLHQTCVDAMNADPDFAKSIVAISDKQIDQKIVTAHQEADFHIQKNERHVFYAYAAMWVIAALFVLFLWMRQTKLLGEIANLKRDLEAAAKDAK